MLRIPALALIGALALTGVAYAGNNSNAINGTLSSKKKNTPVSEFFHLSSTYAGGLVPDIAYQSTISTPNTALNGKYFKSCSVAAVEARDGDTACKSALIGSGTAIALAVPCGAHPPTSRAPATLHFVIAIYNGPGGRSLVSKLRGTDTGNTATGTFAVNIVTGKSGDKFTFSLPDTLLSPAGRVCAPIVDATFKINKKTVKVKKGKLKGKRVGFVQTSAKKCKGKFGYASLYTDGSRTNGLTGPLTRTQIDSASSTSKGC